MSGDDKGNLVIYQTEHELDPASVVRNFRTTVADGKSYDVAPYNLEAILAVAGKTAAQLIVDRANPDEPNMALTTWSGSRARKHDGIEAVAKEPDKAFRAILKQRGI